NADPGVQRAIARWSARRAYDAAGLSSLDWVAPALEALERGDALPPPFDDQAKVWDVLFGKDRVVHAEVVTGTEGPRRVSPQAAAVPALFSAEEPDPLPRGGDTGGDVGKDHRLGAGRRLWIWEVDAVGMQIEAT
ncbi:MAG TPA: hypothetical protein VK988_00630, partial [Acidimicrobiales bacterium]|nr:hypothetical protein [Acidimicrobiales bacterium]